MDLSSHDIANKMMMVVDENIHALNTRIFSLLRVRQVRLPGRITRGVRQCTNAGK
jgi:hypothetical protein